MLRTFLTLLKFALYALLILLGVTFAVQNRGKVGITLFPFPYLFEMPVFLLAIIMFALGSLLGWMIAHKGVYRHRRAHKHAERRASALEDELAGLRSEHAFRPTALPPK